MKRILSASLPAVIIALSGAASAASISVNLTLQLNDANSVDADETSIVGNPEAATLGGTNWNNVRLKSNTMKNPCLLNFQDTDSPI